jgi:hypothetical protein
MLSQAIIPKDAQREEIERRCTSIVNSFVAIRDKGALYQIAAGSAARVLFQVKAYKSMGLTKADYCELTFKQAPRTVDDWVEAAKTYEIIGPAHPIQPTALDQVTGLARIKPQHRLAAWNATAAANGHSPGSKRQLLDWAETNHCLIRKPKPKKFVDPHLEITTVPQAVAYCAHLENQALELKHPVLAAALGYLRHYVAGLAAEPPQAPTPETKEIKVINETAVAPRRRKRGRKPKIRESEGQTELFAAA